MLLPILLISLSAALIIAFAAYAITTVRAPWRMLGNALRALTRSARRTATRQPWPVLAARDPSAIERVCAWAGMPYAAARAAAVAGAILAVLGVVATRSVTPLTLALVLAAVAAAAMLWRARAAQRRFVAHLPDALDALVAGLRAGFALPHALGLVARETRGAIAAVFGALSRADAYQVPMRDAVAMLRPQIRLPQWELVAQALELQSAAFGNIVPVLEEVAHTLRDTQRVEHEVASATASGRLSGFLIASLAPLSLGAFFFFAPSYISVLTQTTTGHILLALAAVFELAGFLIIRKLVTIEY